MPTNDNTPELNAEDPILAWVDRASEGHRRMFTDPAYRAEIERRIEQRLAHDHSVPPTDASTVGGAAEISIGGSPHLPGR
jgi:hypothetical protein